MECSVFSGTTLSSLSRFVAKSLIDSYPSHTQTAYRFLPVSKGTDVSCCVRQVSKVKRVRYKQNFAVHACDLNKTTQLLPSAR